MALADASKKPSYFRRVLSSMGPGLVTGAADDDPSGIATYTMAGAQYGMLFLWCGLITWPLMAVVQMACARVGMETEGGLACALRKRVSIYLLLPVCFLLFAANALNVGADLAAMADCARLVTGLPYHFLVIFFGIVITAATIYLRYDNIAKVLKWLSLALVSYIIVAFISKPDWKEVLSALIAVKVPKGADQWKMLVAILGTTISPYLFFWQASQEIEERRSHKGASDLHETTKEDVVMRRLDISAGTLCSNLVMVFIILSSTFTLHNHGLTNIETSKQAAQALTPIAGSFASFIFSIGIIGVGLLAIPTLTGSAAYALAETMRWREGLNLEFKQARAFYIVIIASTLIAIGLDFSKITPMQALYGSAIINGLLAPFLLIALIWLLLDPKAPKGLRPPRWMTLVLILTTLLMLGAACGLAI